MTDDTAGLDGFRAWLEALNSALADPDWTGELPHPAPIPSVPITVPDSEATAVLVRAARTRDDLVERMARISEELDGMQDRVGAARSYLSHDGAG